MANQKIKQSSKTRIQDLITEFQEYQSSIPSTGSELLQVEYYLGLMPAPFDGIDQLLTIQLKIGEDRVYVVKKIRDFLTAYKQRQPFPFTKKFVYQPEYYRLLREDEATFQLLLTLLDSERLYRDVFDPWSHRHIHERIIMIPPSKVGDLLSLLPEKRTFMHYKQHLYQPLPVKESCPLSFSVHKYGDSFALQNQHDIEPLLLSEDGYCFVHGHLYQLTPVQQNLILSLHHEVIQSPEQKLWILPEQMDYVASDILPLLNQEAKLTIEQSITDQIVQHPLEANIYLNRIWDANEERLTARVVYTYGEYTIDPLREDEKSQDDQRIFIRDTKKEQQIMYLLESADFKYNGRELYLDDEQELYQFLHQVLPQLETLANIYTTESVEQILHKPENLPTPKIDLDPVNHWLEVRFELPHVDEAELQAIIQALREKKRYFRLSTGAFVPLTDQMVDSFQLLAEQGEFTEGKAKLRLPIYRAMQLEKLQSEHETFKWKKGQAFRRLIQNMKDPESMDHQPPATIDPILRDYQRYGFKWLKMLHMYQFGGILADDMGLGKTLQILALILSEVEEKSNPVDSVEHDCKTIPALVVVPASLIYNWQKECSRFAPQLKTLLIHGSQSERKRLLADLQDVDLVITSYPMLRRDVDLYDSYFFQLLILDEAQYFKNQRTQTAQSVKRIQSGTRFALSGTPIENRLEELWSICDIIMPGLFPSQRAFRKLSTDQVAKRVRPFLLRRLKQDVLTELPDKIESVQLLDLSIDQKKVYLATLQKIQEDTRKIIAQDGFQKHRMQILAGLTRLRQICCHPALYLDHYASDSGKFTYFFELLEELLSNQHRVLVFSQFTSMLSLIGKQLTANQRPYHYLDGNTPSKQRMEMVDRFNAGEKDIFLISLRAGGTGLNLTGADTVILYDLWWNPAIEKQAADRAHRMGQKKKVQVIKLVSQGTIEEKIYELHQKKQALVEKIIQPGEQMISSLDEEEIKEILDLY